MTSKKENNNVFNPIQLHVQKGAIISCKDGFLLRSEVTNQWYTTTKVQSLGGGNFLVIGEKKKIEVEAVKNDE